MNRVLLRSKPAPGPPRPGTAAALAARDDGEDRATFTVSMPLRPSLAAAMDAAAMTSAALG